ncbi:YcjF family protein [Algirhabdus cladophorae]|uniref:YcjF family protein n=1 Tax=Algirhabdus cladophorae TaxID=3377108 RepID=UPI003B847BB0
MTKPPKGPVLIDLETEPHLDSTPDTAPPVPDLAVPTPSGQAMQTMAVLAARKPSSLAKWFWSLLGALISFMVSLAAYDFVIGLIARNPILGYAALGLTGLFVLVLLIIALRELAAFGRIRRLDHVQAAAIKAQADGDLNAAKAVIAQLQRLYAGREDTRWGREKLIETQGDVFEADALLQLAELHLLGPLDAAAMKEVEAAARQVATVTAIVPLAFADVVAALTSNVRMIRRIAEIYGGRSGALGSWRLTRTVLTHLVATGAVAVTDDLIGTLAGGGVLAKVSRRFGEGLVNGALTARVGVAALEVCRPLPFTSQTRPNIAGIVKRALTGLFGF